MRTFAFTPIIELFLILIFVVTPITFVIIGADADLDSRAVWLLYFKNSMLHQRLRWGCFSAWVAFFLISLISRLLYALLCSTMLIETYPVILGESSKLRLWDSVVLAANY